MTIAFDLDVKPQTKQSKKNNNEKIMIARAKKIVKHPSAKTGSCIIAKAFKPSFVKLDTYMWIEGHIEIMHILFIVFRVTKLSDNQLWLLLYC